MAVIDAVSRMIPGVIQNGNAGVESHSEGVLEYPQYTRPPEFRGKKVPDILLSGHDAKIRTWRRKQSLLRTREKRYDMFEKAKLTKEDSKLL